MKPVNSGFVFCPQAVSQQMGIMTGRKLYDKQDSVLRVETTLKRPHQFRVYRASERDPESRKRWQVLRKGIGDLHRRAEICEAVNGRYLQALASVRNGQSAGELAHIVCRPVKHDGRRYRGLNPWSAPDAALLQAISRGEWVVSGYTEIEIVHSFRIELPENQS